MPFGCSQPLVRAAVLIEVARERTAPATHSMPVDAVHERTHHDDEYQHNRGDDALAAGSALTLAGGTTPASAAVGNCDHGIDSGTTNWAWGSCNGVTGNSHWRLHVSCTWGSTQYSSWIYGNARVDVECPWPGSVRATQIDIIY